MAKELQAGKTAGTSDGRYSSDSLTINSGAVRGIIRQNLEVIIADNMRKKGIGRERAGGEIKAILDVLERIKELTIQTGKKGDVVRMKMKLRHHLGKELPPGKKKLLEL